jgi:isopenicillin N synthase-like dioxygenase
MNVRPVVDVASFLARDPAGEYSAARAIGIACREIGFFHITGHGVSASVVADVFAASAAFFAAPPSVKRAATFSAPRGNRG